VASRPALEDYLSWLWQKLRLGVILAGEAKIMTMLLKQLL